MEKTNNENFDNFLVVNWENFVPSDFVKICQMVSKAKWQCYEKDEDFQEMTYSIYAEYVGTFANQIIMPMFGKAILDDSKVTNEVMENIVDSLFNFICENRNTIVAVGLNYFTMIECEEMENYGGYRFIMDTMDQEGKIYVFDKWDW